MRLLDLCCGAGGCSVGYASAGFEIVGVDIKPQPYYPFEFHQADSFDFAKENWREFDVIHASPHCQGYSLMRHLTRKSYPKEIEAFREMLLSFGRPYVIENVEHAPLPDLPILGMYSILLCGTMFNGLKIYRHRRFESNLPLVQPKHPTHQIRCAKQGKAPRDGEFITVTGNYSGADYARQAMGIDWMPRDSLSQAIPPKYTELIGSQLFQILGGTTMPYESDYLALKAKGESLHVPKHKLRPRNENWASNYPLTKAKKAEKPISNEKTCKRCCETKKKSEFYASRGSVCITCCKADYQAKKEAKKNAHSQTN